MTLSSIHRIRNSSPGGLRPSTLPLGHGGSHNTDFHTWMGKKHFCFFQTAETGNQTRNSGVKGSGANHYPRAPALSRQKEARSLPMPYSYFKWIQGFFIVQSTTGSTIHSMPLNSLEHCICTTTMTNFQPDRDSNLVPPGYKPQSIRMSHRGRLIRKVTHTALWSQKALTAY